jgi:uncharacterized protein with PIN domain
VIGKAERRRRIRNSQQQIHVQTGGIQADQRSTSHDTTKNFGKLTNKFIKLI